MVDTGASRWLDLVAEGGAAALLLLAPSLGGVAVVEGPGPAPTAPRAPAESSPGDEGACTAEGVGAVEGAFENLAAYPGGSMAVMEGRRAGTMLVSSSAAMLSSTAALTLLRRMSVVLPASAALFPSVDHPSAAWGQGARAGRE